MFVQKEHFQICINLFSGLNQKLVYTSKMKWLTNEATLSTKEKSINLNNLFLVMLDNNMKLKSGCIYH